jgi:hypothetical protein
VIEMQLLCGKCDRVTELDAAGLCEVCRSREVAYRRPFRWGKRQRAELLKCVAVLSALGCAVGFVAAEDATTRLAWAMWGAIACWVALRK